jgi:hypothetical protein
LYDVQILNGQSSGQINYFSNKAIKIKAGGLLLWVIPEAAGCCCGKPGFPGEPVAAGSGKA